MEAILASTEDDLIHSLDCKNPQTAQYIVSRRNVSYFAAGSDTYSPTGTRLMKFNITGDQFLDPSTVRIRFSIHNTAEALDPATNLLCPLSGPWCFFSEDYGC